MRAIATGLTDVGLQREHNEDSFVVLNDCDLFIVADGMGGHRAGDVASRIATETIAEFFRSTAREDATWPFHFDTTMSEEENRLLTGIRIANRQIFERSAKSREYRGMGTTVVGALFSAKRKRMYIGHVGDSRCYRIRGSQLRQMTRDHSLINDYLLAMPDLTEEQKNELPKNVITRALGMQDQVMVDLQADEPIPGDTYLLCSDGLSGMVGDDEILDILLSTDDVVEGCRRLIERANQRGGEDNITAVVVRIESGPDDEDAPSTGAGSRPSTDTIPVQAPPSTSSGPDDAVRDVNVRSEGLGLAVPAVAIPAQQAGPAEVPSSGSPEDSAMERPAGSAPSDSFRSRAGGAGPVQVAISVSLVSKPASADAERAPHGIPVEEVVAFRVAPLPASEEKGSPNAVAPPPILSPPPLVTTDVARAPARRAIPSEPAPPPLLGTEPARPENSSAAAVPQNGDSQRPRR